MDAKQRATDRARVGDELRAQFCQWCLQIGDQLRTRLAQMRFVIGLVRVEPFARVVALQRTLEAKGFIGNIAAQSGAPIYLQVEVGRVKSRRSGHDIALRTAPAT